MNTVPIDKDLLALIREVQARKKQNPPVAKPTWKEICGAAKDDDLFEEAMRLGAEWRAQANREGR